MVKQNAAVSVTLAQTDVLYLEKVLHQAVYINAICIRSADAP